MPSRCSIAIMLQSGFFAYQRSLVEGVSTFARRHGRWSIRSVVEHNEGNINDLGVDGVILFRGSADSVDPKIACVHVGTYAPPEPPGTVRSDNRAIGRAGAEHLLDRGLRHFGFVQAQFGPVTGERREGFQSQVEQAGAEYFGHMPIHTAGGDAEAREQRELCQWLKELPRPVGLMCISDRVAREVAEACAAIDCRVPDEVAIVGCDNDELLCTLANPPLSSVDPAATELGYQAAELLERILEGEPAPVEPRVVPPAGVEERESSDLLAIEDEDLAHAIRFIRDNYTRPINAMDVVEAVPVSRQVLDHRFRRHLGESIHRRIQRLRMQRASELLLETSLSIPQIAERCGFSSREYFSAAFTRERRLSPNAYRRTHGRGYSRG